MKNLTIAEPKAEAILEIKNVSKYFGGITALSDFNLIIHKGELHCLIGPNGAGKTTVFKIIMGVYPPSEGTVTLKHKDITGLSSNKIARQGLSIKMQVPGVYPELSLRDNIRIAAQNYIPSNKIEGEIDRVIDLVKIKELGNPLVKNMSHGQQQWLEIAMALVNKPDLLFLDEPAAGMGPEETEFTANLVTQLNKQGLTILFIEHDMNFVRKIAKQVTVLHQGRKFAEGTLDEIVKNEEVIDIYLGREVERKIG